MKFVLFVEGATEATVLPAFLERWLHDQIQYRLKQRVRVDAQPFGSCSALMQNGPKRAKYLLNEPQKASELIAVISLLDLKGADFPYPKQMKTVDAKCKWARNYMQKQVDSPKFRQHFAVHDLEAWLLSDAGIFPQTVRGAVAKVKTPESVNSTKPPSKFLAEIYESKSKHSYRKVTDGKELFGKLDPQVAYEKCPYLKLLLDEMLTLAQDAEL